MFTSSSEDAAKRLAAASTTYERRYRDRIPVHFLPGAPLGSSPDRAPLSVLESSTGKRMVRSRVPRKILGVIPARYASSRFPGKALARIDSRTMLEHVYERASMARYLGTVIIATDDRADFRRSAALRSTGTHDARRPSIGHGPRRRSGVGI